MFCVDNEKKNRLYTILFFTFFIRGILSYESSAQDKIPYFEIDSTSAEFKNFVSFVNTAIDGNPGYGYSAIDPIILYTVTKNEKYAKEAVLLVDMEIADAESTIATGEKPKVSFDSYLHVGSIISRLAFTYDWANSFLTSDQKKRWKIYADQAIYNVWNHADAKWGGVSHPWSGWSVNNPANNYHYSFLWATISWAMASENQDWLTFLKNDKLPKLVDCYKSLTGGGSMEGTGYGVSHKILFDIYMLWKIAMSLLNNNSFINGRIWANCVIPILTMKIVFLYHNSTKLFV